MTDFTKQSRGKTGIGLLLTCLALFLGTQLQAQEQERPSIGRKLDPFVLPDATGKSHSWKQTEKQQWLVVAFLGTECPLAKHYATRLQEISQAYENRQVYVVGIMSNQHDTLKEIQHFQDQHKITFPLLKDAHNRVADQFRAERTPEIFVLDAQRKLRYHGRVDDQFLIGAVRSQPQQEDLKNALNALTEGKEPAVTQTEAIGCVIGRERISRRSAPVTYSNQISRLFQKRCNDCHRKGQAAPFVLTNYEEARGWAGMIEEVVRDQRMPPWHADPDVGEFSNDCHLAESEKQLIYDWVAAGAPEGDRNDLPEPIVYSTTWQLPRQPDVVFPITPEPVSIQAQGAVKYQYYRVDPGFTEDRWIQGAEIRPGNYAVVHHILVFARPQGARSLGGGEEGGFLAAYVPGLIPDLYPPGMAKKVPAGSELIFQVHYTPIGSVQEDHSQLGLIFADEKSITHQVVTSSATNRHFEIPAHAENHQVTGQSPRADQQVQLLALMPHMHLRGKSFSYALQTGAAEQIPLLKIPRYDFNWQTTYRLKEPLTIPAGSRIHCVAHYDNSSQNPHNPDPEKNVTWGDQTWEEMMIGYFDVAVPMTQQSGEKSVFGSRPRQIIARLDKNGDEELERSEVPEKWQPFILLIDTDRNGRITLKELENAAQKLQR